MGVKGYHTILLGKLEIDGKKILPPQVALNENNISTFQKSILAAYKEIGTTCVNKSPENTTVFLPMVSRSTNGMTFICLDPCSGTTLIFLSQSVILLPIKVWICTLPWKE